MAKCFALVCLCLAPLMAQQPGFGEVDRQKLLERERLRWNKVLTATNPMFNVQPNNFLMEVVQGLKPGRALDVAMGQGRNAIWLAAQGWDVTGFDIADQAVAAARASAQKAGVKINTVVSSAEDFDFGKEKWDLILMTYFGVRGFTGKIHTALKPGGKVVIEAFHREATRNGPIGAWVVFDSNELLDLLREFRILRYEDVEAVADFGMRKTRLVRLLAQKRGQ